MMRRNPLPHACLDCGFLYRRLRTIASLGYLEVPVERRSVLTQSDAMENDTYDWGCRRDLWNPGRPQAVWTSEVAKVRFCPFFIVHEPGANPDEHVRLARERLRGPGFSRFSVALFVVAGAAATLAVLAALGVRLFGW